MKQDPSVSPLKSHLGYWMRVVSFHVSHAFRMKLEASGVTVAEWVVLREMFDSDTMAPSAVAERLAMTRGAISKLVDRLEEKSLLKRSAGTEDRRFQSISLTRQGRVLVPKLAKLADENDKQFFKHLNPADRDQLMRILRETVRVHGLKENPIQ